MSKKKGIRHNKGKLRWRNFPKFLFRPVVEVGSFAEIREGNPNGKYETLNFLKGLSVLDTLDSMDRHWDKLSDPEEPDYDHETGLHHLAHIAWNALVALHYIDTEHDDRELRYEYTEQDVDKFLQDNSELMDDLTKMERNHQSRILERSAEDRAFEFAEQYNKLKKND